MKYPSLARMKQKILLDTDIGNDIDDAVCLAYLLANPDCTLMGITTVSGNPVDRARMCSALCRVAGREIPILPGTAHPLIIAQKQALVPQAVALERWPHATEFPKGQAIMFMRDTIRRHPGEITLLTIGPLTNAALLFSIDPEIPALLKSLVMMVGRFTDRNPEAGLCEWNATCDPHAAAIVYNAPVARHRSIGIDVTRRVTMQAGDVRARFKTPLLEPVLDFAQVWFGHMDSITFHDPLAAVTIFDDKVCAFARGRVSPDISDPVLLGMTRFEQGHSAGDHEVAVDVQPDRFFETFFSVFAPAQVSRCDASAQATKEGDVD